MSSVGPAERNHRRGFTSTNPLLAGKITAPARRNIKQTTLKVEKNVRNVLNIPIVARNLQR